MILNTQIDWLFSSTSPQQSVYDNLANNALGRGIDRYQAKDYAGAVREFKKSLALSPFSENSDKAYEYMAYAYLSQNNVTEAANTYKLMIRRNPSNDSARLSLGNIYFREGKYKEAQQEYSMAVRLNPNSAANRYALGQTYMVMEQYQEAETQFRRVIQLNPRDPNAYDALGQALRRREQYDEAVGYFENAIQLDKKFPDAYFSLGYTYADMGKIDEANQQLELVKKIAPDSSFELQDYIQKATSPKLTAAFSIGGFPLSAGKGTRVATMDDVLTTPNASKEFKVTFMFSKEMDPSSVQNPNNWLISRATGQHLGGAYNWGLPIPQSEISLPVTPVRVAYNEGGRMAEVTLRITQNSDASGTIDPSRVVFRFKGLDAYGKSMDASADEYSSVSKIV